MLLIFLSIRFKARMPPRINSILQSHRIFVFDMYAPQSIRLNLNVLLVLSESLTASILNAYYHPVNTDYQTSKHYFQLANHRFFWPTPDFL